MIITRRSNPLHFARIEFDSLPPYQLRKNLIAVEGADGQAIGPRYLVNVVRCDQTSGPGHVLDNDCGISRHILAHIAGHGARERVKATAGRKTDDDSNHFAPIKILGR